jgi:hypothetical protein
MPTHRPDCAIAPRDVSRIEDKDAHSYLAIGLVGTPYHFDRT